MPVLKINPSTGESLDKTKTVEEIAAEVEAQTKALAEYKERVKTKKPRKKKEEPTETGVAIKVVKQDIPVKVNPFLAPNGEINVEELLEPLNAILKDIEHGLQLLTKGYKVQNQDSSLSGKVDLPKEFEYKPSITRVQNGEDGFLLTKPSGMTSLKYDKLNKDVYVDRIFLKPIDIKELLKYPEKAKTLLNTLIIDGMWQNLWNTKQLDSKKKYFGTKVATIQRTGSSTDFCTNNTTYDEAMIEIRMFSDVTPLPEGL